MNKKITVSIKTLCIVIIFCAVSLIGLYFIFSLNFKTLSTNNDRVIGLISASGTLVGGIIGGLVAYITAAYQVKKHSEQNEHSLRNLAISSLVLIKSELSYNKELLNKFKDDFSKKDSPVFKLISITEWDKCSINITSIVKSQTINDLLKIYQKLRGIKFSTHGIDISEINAVIDQTDTILNEIHSLIDS
ncbi:hypothetical protein ABZ756_00480 [Mammaliicoccus sciuri]